MEAIRTLTQAIIYFSDPENCRRFMIAVRWSDGIVRCPQCGAEKVTYLEKARVYRCYGNHPKQKFSLKVGTVFEDSAIGLEKWWSAVWLVSNCKNGISSYELSRHLGVTQKTAWFMLHRIRLAMRTNSFMKMGGSGGPVEVDETFIGGKARNMHRRKREKAMEYRHKGKTVVLGLLERGGKVRTEIIADRNKPTLQGKVKEHVEKGSQVMTDELLSYWGLDESYAHKVINHAVEYVNGQVHTNGMENFWSLLKRSLGGTYVAVEPFHLSRYLDEQVFRYNHRSTREKPMTDADRFVLAASQIAGKRLTYEELTGKVLGTEAF